MNEPREPSCFPLPVDPARQEEAEVAKRLECAHIPPLSFRRWFADGGKDLDQGARLAIGSVGPDGQSLSFRGAGQSAATELGEFLQKLHYDSARVLNDMEGQPGRKVWYNFRDTRLTHQYSYLARLNYVHQNAVKHRLVAVANQYP